MQGSWNHDAAHYRCKAAYEYALANNLDHPKTVYVREAPVLVAIDEWLTGLFDPERIDETCRALSQVKGSPECLARIEGARRMLNDIEDRLAKLTAAIEAGSPADLLAPRLKTLQGERLRAEAELQASRPDTEWTPEAVRILVDELGDLGAVLAMADPKLKAQLYDELGLELQFNPERRTVLIEASPGVLRTCRRGEVDSNPTTTRHWPVDVQ
jgi:site-specific DNA recombinase